MVDEAAKTGASTSTPASRLARAGVRPADACSRCHVPRDRIDALPRERRPGSDPALPARGAALAHPRLRAGPLDDDRRLVSARGHRSLAWDGGAGRAADLLRPLKLFPETVPAIEVLRFMRRERQRIAIAVDEHGGVSGLVTFEDLVEELVGEIFSEHDEDLPALTPRARRDGLVRGDTQSAT